MPADAENVFLDQFASSDLAILVRTRFLEDETPPTLFKNNWFFRRIDPLLKLYGSAGLQRPRSLIFLCAFHDSVFWYLPGRCGLRRCVSSRVNMDSKKVWSSFPVPSSCYEAVRSVLNLGYRDRTDYGIGFRPLGLLP